jgi:tetratricopeptide (TPR) repeat protein
MNRARLRRCSFLLAVILSLSVGCATTNRPLSASGKPISSEAISNAVRTVEEQQIPESIRQPFVAMYAEGRENQALYAMDAGLAAVYNGDFPLAARTLDTAIADVDSLMAGAKAAQRASGKFVGEQEKWFKGESYERSALFFFRGLLYLTTNDFGNAAACFKRAQLYDITGDDSPRFGGDWYSCEWGLAFAAYKQGFPDEAQQAMERAAKFSTRQGEVPPPEPNQNVLVVVLTGGGPIKTRAGKYGERLVYVEGPNPVTEVEIRQGDKVLARSAPAESLYVQATTRGTRQVDYLLAGKANFKEGTQVAATALGVGAVIASQQKNSGVATGVLGGLALLSALVSSATTPEADIRMWNNLPHSIFLIGLTLPPGEQKLEVRGIGPYPQIVEATPFVRAGDPLQIVFVRM